MRSMFGRLGVVVKELEGILSTIAGVSKHSKGYAARLFPIGWCASWMAWCRCKSANPILGTIVCAWKDSKRMIDNT